MCRKKHHLPKKGFFPSATTRVNLLEINALSLTTKPDKGERGKKILWKFCGTMSGASYSCK